MKEHYDLGRRVTLSLALATANLIVNVLYQGFHWRHLLGYVAAFGVAFGLYSLVVWLGKRYVKKHGSPWRPRTRGALCLRMGAALLAVWLLCMSMFTLGLTQYVVRDLRQTGQNYAVDLLRSYGLDRWYTDNGDICFADYYGEEGLLSHFDDLVAGSAKSVQVPYFSGEGTPPEALSPLRFRSVTCDTAVLICDKDGSIVGGSGNCLYFWYYTEEEWKNRGAGDSVTHYGRVDISPDAQGNDPYAVLREAAKRPFDLRDYETLRIEGTVEGTDVTPVAMYYINRDKPTWQKLFDHRAQYDGDKPLMTLYTQYPSGFCYAGAPVRYRFRDYESLRALLETIEPTSDLYNSMSKFDLRNFIAFSNVSMVDLRGYVYTPGNDPKAEYTILTALHADPLAIAMYFLRGVYIWSFLFIVLCFLLLRHTLKLRLTDPLEALAAGAQNDWRLADKEAEPYLWRELAELRGACVQEADRSRRDRNELARLNTALDYARAAEEDRRQMVSNIAHELKTPMAVIHSYAEGLKEHIAEEKREKYLDVILSEAERADAMVLEMLDLSRLEAGKVKLARDEFDLCALVRAVAERLERPAEDRGLHLAMDLPETCVITADEGRIGQVVENFLSNAVKYTPEGGNVTLRLRNSRGKVRFAVENDSPPLSEETLTKVWDSFYRADEARSGGGTGLGLAIARSIIQLHGGACTARNTDHGVEFSFLL